MAEKIKDAEDRFLESILHAEAIANDGFSDRVVARLRRRIWLRRLALPVAALIGGAIAARPVYELVNAGARLLIASPTSMTELPAALLPEVPNLPTDVLLTQTVIFGALLLVAGFVSARLLHD